jgi:hypothetical protein
MELLNVHFYPTSCHFIFGPDILLSILFSNTFSLCASLNIRDHVSHPYTTQDIIVVVCILMFTFIDSRREDGMVDT